MNVCQRIAVIRREVKRIAGIAAARAAQTESPRAAPSFRPLNEAEVAALVGRELAIAEDAMPDDDDAHPMLFRPAVA
jgi:hypothetical protein